MISVKFLKNSARMQEFLKNDSSMLYSSNSDTSAYIRKETKFFPGEICRNCKEKLNLNSDKFIKEK